MIVVIADDFSGAAEIAGIAWRNGLRTMLKTDPDFSDKIDVLVIDTNTRSGSKAEARTVHQSLAKTLSNMQVDWIFKKTDSILRGHLMIEIDSLLTYVEKKQVLIIANNPSSGRIIRDEHYYINETALHQTDFKNDPEFPIKTSNVKEIIGPSKKLKVMFVKKEEKMGESGIYFPEIVNTNDVYRWASLVNDGVLPAGGSDFFEALIKFKGSNFQKQIWEENKYYVKKILIVSGSTTEKSKETIHKLHHRGIPVCGLPCSSLEEFDFSENILNVWVNQVINSFQKSNSVVSAILKPLVTSNGFPKMLNDFISKMIELVLDREGIDVLIIEGGSTISHLSRHLGWKKFVPVLEYTRGVVELAINEKPGCRLIVKPGSYPWPEEILTKIFN